MLYPLSYEGDVADFTRSAYGDCRRRKQGSKFAEEPMNSRFGGNDDNKGPVSRTFVMLNSWLPFIVPCAGPLSFRDIL